MTGKDATKNIVIVYGKPSALRLTYYQQAATLAASVVEESNQSCDASNNQLQGHLKISFSAHEYVFSPKVKIIF